MSYTKMYSGIDDTLMPAYERNRFFDTIPEVQGNEEDILSDIPPAAFLTGENVNGPIHDFRYNVIPPSRANTQHMGEVPDFSQLLNNDDEGQSWERMVISGASEAAPIPSSGGSAPPSEVDTFLSDSGFVSLHCCEECQRKYKNPSQRKKHILTHIKPYKCTSQGCKRQVEGFATPNDLDRHAKSVHKEGPQMWYKCAYPNCEKTNKDHFFDRKDNFNAHIKRRHEHLKLNSEIERLVRSSEYVPKPAEIKAALTKCNGLSRTSSGRASGPRNARKQKARSEKSDDVSAYSPSSFEPATSTQPLTIPASAPEISYFPDFSFSSMNDFAGIGAAVETLEQRATFNLAKGKRQAILDERDQQSLHARSSGASHSFNFATQRFASSHRHSARQGHGPTSAPQEIFQAIPQDQYTTARTFNSSLSSQLQHQQPASFPTMQQGFSDAMQSLHGRRQTQPTCPSGGAYPGMMQSSSNFPGDSAFSPYGSSQVSLSPSVDPALQPLNAPESFSSSFYDQSLGVAANASFNSPLSPISPYDSFDFDMTFPDMDLDNGSFSPLFRQQDIVDEG